MRTGLRRVVRETVALGVVLPLLVLAVLQGAGPVLPVAVDLPGPGAALLSTVLLLLTLVANRVAVPVRRGEQIEELTLLESAVIVDVLLLPAGHALWLPVAAVVLSSLVTRRELVKSLFNAGNLAASSAVLVLAVHLVSGPDQGLSARTVAGLLLGLAAFTVVNLANLSRVLSVVQQEQAGAVLTDGARLAVLTLPGHLSIAGSAVLAGTAAPALLPFAFVPAVALVFAFRARAQESQERERSARLLALSQTLASLRDPDALLPTFLDLVRQAFDADVAVVRLDGDPGRVLALHRDGDDAVPSSLAALASGHEAQILPALPDGGHGLVAPLAAEGRRFGALVLAAAAPDRALGKHELLLLTPLAGLLAAALQAADHVQRLTEATTKLQAVVDQSSDGILVLDGDGVVQLWSPALAGLTGVVEPQALGRRVGALLGAQQSDGTGGEAFAAGLDAATPHAVVEQVLLRADGEQRLVRCAHAAAFDGDGALLSDVVLVHDVTRERQVERLKADFIATVSHELRTPVTPIKGYAELLRRRGESMTPERRAECLAVISDRCDHLARLVEDLLLASRISAEHGSPTTQVDLSSVDLIPLVDRVVGDLGPVGTRVVLVVPPEPVGVRCDPLRAVQVLANLVGNALKYSPAISPVQVHVEVVDGVAQVQVHDEGRGIPADQLERVFEKFHRVEDPLRMTTGGTGLGLYIARQLTTAMGGTLRCTSRLGSGSVFHLTLPLADAPVLPPPRTSRAPAPTGLG